MIEPKNEFAKILSELEREIKDPRDLEIAKSKLFEVGMLFMDVATRALESNTQYDMLSKRIDKMQKSLKRIEEDIYIDDEEDDDIGDQMHDNDINTDEDFEFEIKCPYCNYEFIIGNDEDLKDEIECPKCHKEIELDWDDYCDGECDHCGSICYSEELDNAKKGHNTSNSELEYSLSEDDEEYDINNNQENKSNNKKEKDNSSNKNNQKSSKEENLKNQDNNENDDDM